MDIVKQWRCNYSILLSISQSRPQFINSTNISWGPRGRVLKFWTDLKEYKTCSLLWRSLELIQVKHPWSMPDYRYTLMMVLFRISRVLASLWLVNSREEKGRTLLRWKCWNLNPSGCQHEKRSLFRFYHNHAVIGGGLKMKSKFLTIFLFMTFILYTLSAFSFLKWFSFSLTVFQMCAFILFLFLPLEKFNTNIRQ